MESKVKEVLGVAKKKDGSEIRGEKNGKKWVMMRVVLENDIELNMFAPVEVGDEVTELVQDPTYHSWKGKVKKTSKNMARMDMSEPMVMLLNQILDELKKMNENLTGHKSPESKSASKFETFVAAKEEMKDNIIEDIDEPVDLASIPF